MQEGVEAVRAASVPHAFSGCRKRRIRRTGLRIALLASDSLMLAAATTLATYVRFERLGEAAAFEGVALGTIAYYEISIWVTGLWLFALWTERLYDLDRVFWGSGEFSRVARALSFGVIGFILLTYAIKTPGLSRAWTLLAWTFAVVGVTLGRLGIRACLSVARRRGKLQRPTLVVGSNPEGAAITEILRGNRAAGLVPVGCLASSQAEKLDLQWCPPDVPCLGAARDIVQIVRDHDIDTVIIASSAFDHDVLARVVAEIRGLSVDVHVSSGLFEVLTSRVTVREVCGVPLITVKGISLSPVNQFVKRAFDVLVAGTIIVVGLPVWLALIVCIKLDSKGPVFFKQARVGKGGVPFGMFKFRSMVDDAEALLAQLMEDNQASGPLFKMRDDPRVTRVGRWMRKYSIDEFPQLLNVLRGEMSLVGPRPPLVHETEQYTDRHWRRMEVLPGMTGLWQVSGRSNLSFDEMVRLDIFYMENWSVALDISLLMRTVPAVLLAKGAY